MAWFRNLGEQLGHVWRRSLQLRVVVSTLTLSLIVITILGVVLTSQITDRLLDAKINAAVEEMGRARNTVQNQLTGVHDSGTQQSRLDDARRALFSSAGGTQTGGAAGSYEAALAMTGDSGQELTSGSIQEIPTELRQFVKQRQVSYQFSTVSSPDGYKGSALIIGSPSADIDSLEIYLIFPLTNEQRSLSLMRGTMLIGGIVLLVLLAAITALVTRQVVLPIRSAARIASRFADGRLKERMLVRGEDDMARLAMSFNEMAESLSNQITQLEEFGNLQRRFTSDVSHELRTPLTTVRMAADLIHGSSDDLDPALARSAELLVNELDRFEGLLNDLLEISRHDAGVAELQVESLDVRMCARAAVSTVRHLARESGVELVVDMPEEPLVAEVDPRRVERVLRNLLANAIDHSEGKPVLMRMRGDVDANAVAIVVRDQGVGLRPGEEKLVFNRFWRSDPSRMRRSGGTGLGLSISVEDANLHEGKLEAWGELGVGASFRLTLPLVRGRKLGTSPLPLEPPKIRGAFSPEQLALDIAGSDAPAGSDTASGDAAAGPDAVPGGLLGLAALESVPTAIESDADGRDADTVEPGFDAIAPEFPAATGIDDTTADHGDVTAADLADAADLAVREGFEPEPPDNGTAGTPPGGADGTGSGRDASGGSAPAEPGDGQS
ncbi:MtrAB system histidine kinase MtrB [Nocardia sp. NPDC059764]|uniref:MtrAB system histidine kinase MtrB n=1 Tax=Nocardia sp. NPDC059764 TaxID=3346939 RepID=UPI0036667E88